MESDRCDTCEPAIRQQPTPRNMMKGNKSHCENDWSSSKRVSGSVFETTLAYLLWILEPRIATCISAHLTLASLLKCNKWHIVMGCRYWRKIRCSRGRRKDYFEIIMMCFISNVSLTLWTVMEVNLWATSSKYFCSSLQPCLCIPASVHFTDPLF